MRIGLYFGMIFIVLLSTSCGSLHTFKKQLRKAETKGVFKNQFTGVMVFDPAMGDTLVHHNAEKYFIPASNTKIFTLFLSLQTLPDSVPTLRYKTHGDTLYFQPTADPLWLNPYLTDSTAVSFISKFKKAVWVQRPMIDHPKGNGWAWDDFDAAYAPERSAMPLYGNVVNIKTNENQQQTIPLHFSHDVDTAARYPFYRLETENRFFTHGSRDTLEIPFKTDTSTLLALLSEVLKTKVDTASVILEDYRYLYGKPTDTLLIEMMQHSDNFMAEQLNLMASGWVSDTINGQQVRDIFLKETLSGLAHPPRWVDGSGLSRYNLFTPESLVYVLNELYKKYPQERLFSFFPAGGQSGTLKNHFEGESTPFVFAKTGTLSNNYALSGYLITRKDKVLIFSFMNNHFRSPVSEVKKQMQALLEILRAVK